MTDVLAELKTLHSNWERGSGITDIALLERAIAEIERLRDHLGQAIDLAQRSQDLTFTSLREIKDALNGPSV